MKILFISPVLPYPLISGGRIRAYNLLKNISQQHTVTLFTFLRKNEEQHIPEVEKICHKVIYVRRRNIWSFINLVLTAFLPFPLLMVSYFSLAARKLLKNELLNNYDLISSETFYVLSSLLGLKKPPLVLTEHNIEYLVFRKYIDRKTFLLKPLLQLDLSKLVFWEQHYWRKVDKLIAVSGEDKKIIEKVSSRKVLLVPNGIDKDFFERTKKQRRMQKTAIFVGNFSWLPNSDAATFLVKEIWPKIYQKIPSAKLLIIGKNASIFLKEIIKKTKGVILKENVEDIRNILAVADVLIAPLRLGRGTRYKILESMAAGVCVVTTSLGIEGIEARPGKHVLIGDNEQEIALRAIELLENKDLNNKMSKVAQRFVFERYNWENIGKGLNKIYHEICDNLR